MVLLLVVSFIWAFSFGLIKGRLAGLDPTAVAVLRLSLAVLVFLPFLRVRALSSVQRLQLVAIGAIQFGAMYVFYLRAFAHLQSFEVALFTITTPVFVAVLDGALSRKFALAHTLAALLSVAGAAVVLWHRLGSHDVMVGLVFVQLSNVCFAIGQVAWRRVRANLPANTADAGLFALPFAGALAATVAWSLFSTDWMALRLSSTQIGTLLYLGILASGLCFFWWNLGSTRVNAGTLAAFNNAKIPLAVACSLLFFGEHADVGRLVAGGALLVAGIVVAERVRAIPAVA